uniref:Putative ovule protein n=1 Tax=Solanum chacoense TaxID=4108 RepID=A0A0V0GEE8_SOLCH
MEGQNKTTLNYLLTFYPNPCPPQSPIYARVLSKLKLCHVLSNHPSPIVLRPTSTSPETINSQPLTRP